MTEYNKPPLGLRPRRIHLEQRLQEIDEAIDRYSANDKTIPNEWYKEVYKILTELRLMN